MAQLATSLGKFNLSFLKSYQSFLLHAAKRYEMITFTLVALENSRVF
jgi:hypothetical protein